MLSKLATQLVEKTFKDLNLSEEHARVYLKLLENGPTPASYIAKQTKIPRTTTYSHLNDLIKLGLASSVLGETKTIFMPSSPEQLQFIVMQKSLQFQHHLKNLDHNLPQLKTLFSSHEAKFPSVQFFEGENGLKTVLYDTFSVGSSGEVLWICQGSEKLQSGLDKDPKYLKDFIREFTNRKIKSKELIENTPAGKEYKQKYSSKFVQVKLIPKRSAEKFGHVDKAIYENKIAYISHDNKVGIIIEDETLAAHEKQLFEDLWQMYK